MQDLINIPFIPTTIIQYSCSPENETFPFDYNPREVVRCLSLRSFMTSRGRRLVAFGTQRAGE